MFFLWFPLCRGEAGLFVTPMYGYFCNSFPLVPVVGLFSPLFFLLCLSRSLFTQSSHLSCGLPRFLQPSCFIVQTRHNFVGEIRIFSVKIRINPYPSFRHRCIAKTFTRFISRCSLQKKSRHCVIKIDSQ